MQISPYTSKCKLALLYVPYYRDKILLQRIGNHLRNIRLSKKLTQEEVSYRAELDITQVGRIERGAVNTSICVLQRLAKALDIKLKDILDF
ncbi:MAG: helix-turn-helix transcriptional regulator [Flavobacteriales bacterium]|nr:helix-turn-helix transcriptional regulator [Flavobacteriales bacterium]